MSEAVEAPPVWRVASATKKGSAHPDGVPNQDALQFVAVPAADGRDAWIAAVSDGHGGKRYVRSDVGAALAVGIAVSHFAEVIRGGVGTVPLDDVLRREMPEVVAEWRKDALAHQAAQPFTTEETARAGESLQLDPIVAYGATLLIVVVCSGGVGVAQIGDGDALIRTHGFATRPVPGDPRLVAGETTSLCLDTAVQDFRYAALPASADPDLVMLSSDGYSNSFADADWWRSVVDDLVRFIDDRGFDTFTEQFPGWLAESALVGGDDVTAVVIARAPFLVAPGDRADAVVPTRPEPAGLGAVPAGAEPVTIAVPPKTVPLLPGERIEDDVPAPDSNRTSRRGYVYALLVVSVVVVAAVVLLVVRSHSGTTPPPSGVTTSTSPSSGVSSPAPSATGHHHRKQRKGNPVTTPITSKTPALTASQAPTGSPTTSALRKNGSGDG